MPVVARCNLYLSDFVAVGRSALIVMAICLFGHSDVNAQDSAEAAPSTAAPVEGAPAESAAAEPQDAAPAQPVQDNQDVQPVNQGCMQYVIDQHALTLKVRAINNPLERIPDKEYQLLRRNVISGIQSGAANAADLQSLDTFLKYRMFQATEPPFVANPDNVKNLLNEMDREIRGAGSQVGNAQEQRRYRQKYCDAVLAVAKQMLDNSLDARSVAIQILKSLYVAKTQTRTDTHSESLAVLIGLLKDPGQPDSVKAMATTAIGHVLVNTAVIPQEQDAVSDAIAAELDRPCAEVAYQCLLVDTLFYVTVPRKTIGSPITTSMRTFVKLVDDKTRPLQVRCRAAFGIGQGAFDNKVDFDALTWKVANLALEASVYFNQAPGNPAWQQCGADLFFAYRHADRNGLAKQPPMFPQGMMNRAAQSAAVNASAELVLKIAVPLVVNKDKVPQADQVALKAWIDANSALNAKKWDP